MQQMSQPLAKGDVSEELSENYESIASEQQQSYTRQQICFPSMPAQFGKIYQIYRQNTERVSRLQQKVGELQSKILELQRYKSNKNMQEIQVQFLQEQNEQSLFMSKYIEKCEKRKKEVEVLGEIYSQLKRLNTQVNIFGDPKIAAIINKYIQQHRRVVSYSHLPNYILLLCREVHNRKKHFFHMPSNNRVGSQSSAKKDKKNKSHEKADDCQQKQQVNFTLRLVNTKNLIHTLKPKEALDLEGIFDANQLEQIKQNSEKEVSIFRTTKIQNKKAEFLQATYSQEQQMFILLDTNKKLITVDSKGNSISYADLDQMDNVVLMEVKKRELWVGTSEGILRVYLLQGSNLKLNAIFSCFYKDMGPVSSYLLIGDSKIQRIVFSIHNNFYQLNTNNYSVKHCCEISEPIQYIVGSHLVSAGQISKLTASKDKYEISRNQRLTKWYYEHSSKNKEQKILYIQEAQKQMNVVVGDVKGHLQMISI